MYIVIIRCLPTEAMLHLFFKIPIREKFLPKCVSALRVITIIIVFKQNILYVIIFCQIIIYLCTSTYYLYGYIHATTVI